MTEFLSRLAWYAVAFVLAICAAVALASVAMAHGDAQWIMERPETRHCCGPQDCRELAEGEARNIMGAWHVNGRPVAPQHVYPSRARDAHYWACFRVPELVEPRCLFLPLLG